MLTIVLCGCSLHRVVSWAQLYSESRFNFVGFKPKSWLRLLSVAVWVFWNWGCWTRANSSPSLLFPPSPSAFTSPLPIPCALPFPFNSTLQQFILMLLTTVQISRMGLSFHYKKLPKSGNNPVNTHKVISQVFIFIYVNTLVLKLRWKWKCLYFWQ